MDAKRYATATKLFEQMGLTTSEAINIFYASVIHNRAIPFPLEANLPLSKETQEALNEDLSKEKGYTAKDLIKELFERRKTA